MPFLARSSRVASRRLVIQIVSLLFLVIFSVRYITALRPALPPSDVSDLLSFPTPKKDLSFGEWNPKSFYFEPYDDPTAELLHADFSVEDVRHSSVADSISMVLHHGIRMSGFDTTNVYLSREERNFLIRYKLLLLQEQKERINETRKGLENGGASSFNDTTQEESQSTPSAVRQNNEEEDQKREEALASLSRWRLVEPENQHSPLLPTVVWEPAKLLPALTTGNFFFPRPNTPIVDGNDEAESLPLPSPHPHPFNLFLDDYVIRDRMSNTFSDTFCDAFVELMKLPDSITNGKPLIVHHRKVRLARFVIQCLFYRHHELQRTSRRKFVLLTIDGFEVSTFSFFMELNYDHVCAAFPATFKNKVNITNENKNLIPTLESLAIEASDVDVSYLVNHPLLLHWYSTNHAVDIPGKTTSVPLGLVNLFSTPTFTNAFLPRSLEDNYETKIAEHMHLLFHDLNLDEMFGLPASNYSSHLRFGRSGVVHYERALELFAGTTTDPPVKWIPLELLPRRITTVYVVLMPLEPERRKGRPSLTNEVLVFPSENEGGGNRATAAAEHVALLPFTAALFHKLKQHPFGEPSRELKVTTGFTVWGWRKSFRQYLDAHPELTIEVKSEEGRMSYLERMLHVAFVASPIGYGYDCFRTWEALMHGAVPILEHPEEYSYRICKDIRGIPLKKQVVSVVHNRKTCSLHLENMTKVFDDLPVVVVKDLSEITLENLEKWREEIYRKAKEGKYKLEKLFTQYWIDLIQGHSNVEK